MYNAKSYEIDNEFTFLLKRYFFYENKRNKILDKISDFYLYKKQIPLLNIYSSNSIK